MALILNFEDYRNTPPKILWSVEDWIMSGQLIGYRVVRFNPQAGEQEVLDGFFVDSTDNNMKKYAEAWNKAATLMNRANKDVMDDDV